MENAPALDGAALRRARERAGLSQNAINSGVSTVKRWEADGLASPSAATLSALAAALHTSTDTIRLALSV